MAYNIGMLNILFNFGFCLFFTPFRISVSVSKLDGKRSPHIQTVIIQQIVCAISQFLGTLVFVGEAIENLKEVNKTTTPATYFNAFYGITSLFMCLTGVWWVWRKQKLTLKIIKRIETASDVSQKMRTIMTTITIFLCLMATAMSIASAVLGVTLFPVWLWSPNYLWKRSIITARTRFLGYNKTDYEDDLKLIDVPLGHSILGGMLAVGSLFKWINQLFLELSLLIGILSFWMLSYSFAKCVERSQDIGYELDWNKIARKFKRLKNFTKLFNNTYGGLIFIYVWNSLLMYATRFDTLFTHTDEFFRWRGLMYFYAVVAFIFILSADCSRQAQNISTWLSIEKNSEMIASDNALTYIMNDISQNAISVSGLRIFSITYGFVANVTGIVVTYFIICVQFRGTHSNQNLFY